MADNDLVFDTWTPLSFKRSLGNRRAPGATWYAPDWVGDHARRLQAYKMLQAYLDNAGRVFLATDDEAERDRHREYGDAALIRDTILAALLGSDVSLTVDGADDYDPDFQAEETPAEGDDDPTTEDDYPAADPEAQNEAARASWEFQEWIREWFFAKERGRLKILETERNAVGLGDGVYTLGYNDRAGRVRLRVWDPGFYFPVLDDGNEDDFPRTVHLAWEMPDDPKRPGRTRIRRLTWALRDIRPVLAPDGAVGRAPVLDLGDTQGEDGRISRSVPYQDEPVYETCYFSDGVWDLGEEASKDVLSLDVSNGAYTQRDTDLRIDFIPVVHVPNTVAVLNHYGQSSVARVLQVLDDLANVDTDLQGAAATAGKPILALEGGTLGNVRASYAPGEVWETGGGKLHWLTTEGALAGLGELSDRLYSRLSSTARLPEGLLGRVSAAEVPSGVALQLSFGPLSSLIAEMRLARAEKYPLLFRFAWRMSRAAGLEDVPAEYHETELSLGSFLPSDRSAVVAEVAKLLEAKAISRLSAVRILISAGLDVDDANEEVDRLEAADFEGAGLLLDVTGDIDQVREYLKLPVAVIPPREEQPPPTPEQQLIDPATGLPFDTTLIPAPAPVDPNVDPATGLPFPV